MRRNEYPSRKGRLTHVHQLLNSSVGLGDSDQIDPVVAEALTLYQLEWLCGHCKDLDVKKLHILRQALFEWIYEHPDYRFSTSTFGYVTCVALENYINRHEGGFVPVRRRTR
jgi:hypothetical protein